MTEHIPEFGAAAVSLPPPPKKPATEDRRPGILLVISGPSGAGKSTILSAVMSSRYDMFFSVSATTRLPRPGEKNGEHYYFYSREEFIQMRDSGELLEWAEFAGNYYGTPAAPIFERLEHGNIVVLDVETRGALEVMKKVPNAVSIFLTPSTLDEVERRLRLRGTESEEKIQKRMEIARRGYDTISHYTYLVINDSHNLGVAQINAILLAEQCKTYRMPDLTRVKSDEPFSLDMIF